VRRIVFSSSATVYGSAPLPETGFAEDTQVGVGITNAYGASKFMIERILEDLHASPDEAGDKAWTIAILRYFNPVGAHSSGRIGEDPQGIPNNLFPYVQQVAVGRRPHLTVFAEPRFDTKDGTGVRDYIHVVDLANGHVKALEWVEKHAGECSAFNLGTGNGLSVIDMAKAMEAASGKEIPLVFGPRRPGDLAVVYGV